MSGGVRQIKPPPAARARSTLPRVDYADAFLVDAGRHGDRTGEEWAHAVFETAPATLRSRLPWAWWALGLRIGSTRSDRLLFGWEVRERTPDSVLLGARSRIGMPAELLFERREGTLLFATLVQHTNPAVRALWALVTPTHQHTVRSLLEHAAR
jgi:hypothetical protein